jgi:hypothetical protein
MVTNQLHFLSQADKVIVLDTRREEPPPVEPEEVVIDISSKKGAKKPVPLGAAAGKDGKAAASAKLMPQHSQMHIGKTGSMLSYASLLHPKAAPRAPVRQDTALPLVAEKDDDTPDDGLVTVGVRNELLRQGCRRYCSLCFIIRCHCSCGKNDC